jgi:hypothetical protein
MSIELKHNSITGQWSLTYKRHIFVGVGFLLLASGLATLSGPWWEGILLAALNKAGITIASQYQWQIAIGQIILGIGALCYKYFIIDPTQIKIATDRTTFAKANFRADEIRNYLSTLVDDHSYKSSLNTIFHEAHTHFKKPEASFQHAVVAKAYENFSASGSELQNFVGVNFFVFPNGHPADGDYRYCLAPHLNDDRGMVFYDAAKAAEYTRLSQELHRQVSETQQKFDAWLRIMKSIETAL